jgi:hypothetical protein
MGKNGVLEGIHKPSYDLSLLGVRYRGRFLNVSCHLIEVKAPALQFLNLRMFVQSFLGEHLGDFVQASLL